jgi:hypothetical protein
MLRRNTKVPPRLDCRRKRAPTGRERLSAQVLSVAIQAIKYGVFRITVAALQELETGYPFRIEYDNFSVQ